MNDTVVIVKLAQSFADVFCMVDSDKVGHLKDRDFETITLKSPMIAQIVPDQHGNYGVQLHVLCQFMAEEPRNQEVTVDRDSILFTVMPVEEMAKQYRSKLSGIQEASVADIQNLKG